jgi:hypothetical protein
MHYTVRLHVRVRNSRRSFRSFIRAEYAPNTSSHADKFDSLESAENAADKIAEHYTAAGHTVLSTDFFKVGE